ncbi:MAG: ThiF family adenylyltransferase [Micromonosporaceae bacterium]|nr:ThiF family adenylyltransferase [Micromonosporaceae bacterium]
MRILFCGVGALGSTAATLCRNLPATLAFVDFDRVEAKNLASQAYTRQAVGRNKAEALRAQLRTFYGIDSQAYPVRLSETNIAELAAGADLLVDCLDNIAGRTVILEYAGRAALPSVHAGLAADGTFGLVRWGERFVPDAEDEPGQATCEGGEHLPFIGLVAGRLASIIAGFVRDGTRTDALVTPAGG